MVRKKGILFYQGGKLFSKTAFHQVLTNNSSSFQGGCQTSFFFFFFFLALLWEVTKETGLRMAFGKPGKSQSQS